jgi:SAM-dependent methyltransferase
MDEACLTDAQDAFGHLLLGYLDGENGLELVERDDGFIGPAGSARRYFALPQEWPAYERAALDFARGRVLDIGCGAGRHALYLQERGLEVVGLDVSPLAIAVCARRGLRQTRVLDIAQIDANAGTWDTLLLLGANLGLLGGADGAHALLARLHRASGAGARIIAESRDPASIEGAVHAAYRAANRRSGRLPGQLRLRIRYKQYATPWFDYLFLAKGELEQLLAGTGWSVARHLDGEASAYIAIIEKVGA